MKYVIIRDDDTNALTLGAIVSAFFESESAGVFGDDSGCAE
jgi:hypothetical protein